MTTGVHQQSARSV